MSITDLYQVNPDGGPDSLQPYGTFNPEVSPVAKFGNTHVWIYRTQDLSVQHRSRTAGVLSAPTQVGTTYPLGASDSHFEPCIIPNPDGTAFLFLSEFIDIPTDCNGGTTVAPKWRKLPVPTNPGTVETKICVPCRFNNVQTNNFRMIDPEPIPLPDADATIFHALFANLEALDTKTFNGSPGIHRILYRILDADTVLGPLPAMIAAYNHAPQGTVPQDQPASGGSCLVYAGLAVQKTGPTTYRLHLFAVAANTFTHAPAAETIRDLVYAWSDDLGQTWHPANSTAPYPQDDDAPDVVYTDFRVHEGDIAKGSPRACAVGPDGVAVCLIMPPQPGQSALEIDGYMNFQADPAVQLHVLYVTPTTTRTAVVEAEYLNQSARPRLIIDEFNRWIILRATASTIEYKASTDFGRSWSDWTVLVDASLTPEFSIDTNYRVGFQADPTDKNRGIIYFVNHTSLILYAAHIAIPPP